MQARSKTILIVVSAAILFLLALAASLLSHVDPATKRFSFGLGLVVIAALLWSSRSFLTERSAQRVKGDPERRRRIYRQRLFMVIFLLFGLGIWLLIASLSVLIKR
jgi:drug/metabolite transporter (DMT)-like permease